MSSVERVKSRWGVGIWGVVAILAAFSLAGMTVLRLKNPILGLILPADAPAWVWWTVYVLLVIPFYEGCLLMYGTLLGQFSFFWKKNLAVGRFVTRLVKFSKN